MFVSAVTYEQKFRAKQAIDSFFRPDGVLALATLVSSDRPLRFARGFALANVLSWWCGVLAWRVGRHLQSAHRHGSAPA